MTKLMVHAWLEKQNNQISQHFATDSVATGLVGRGLFPRSQFVADLQNQASG
nr:hypothetical protein [Vibrio vulnificus]